MESLKHSGTKRMLKILCVVVGLGAFVLLALRTMYAVSLYGDLTSGLAGSGWTEDTTDPIMQPREEMTYEASYLLFKIGTVRMQVLGKTIYDNKPAYRLRAYIDSYSGIPFVNLHSVFETYADAQTHYCLFTSNSQKEGDDWVYTSYRFDTANKKIEWEQSRNGKVIKTAQCPLDKYYTDGVSFFYYLREASRAAQGKKTKLSIPIAVDTVRSRVELTINEKREPCEVTAFDYPLDSYRMSGHLDFTGYFGVTGDFKGWMSTDSSEVPLRGEVKVIIGSIVVKLKAIQRAGWTPARSAE